MFAKADRLRRPVFCHREILRCQILDRVSLLVLDDDCLDDELSIDRDLVGSVAL